MSKQIQFSLQLFLVLVSLVLVPTFLALNLFPQSLVFPAKFPEVLANWDGRHFISIAQYGYAQTIQYAFFPLYPILVNFVARVASQNYLWSALVVSWLSTFLTLHYLYKLLSLDLDQKLVRETLILLVLFPTSFFLLSAYSESVFLLFSVMAFYFARKKNFLLATVFAALSTATRISGLATVLALWMEGFYLGGFKKNWIVLLAPVGILVYMYYLGRTTGDPLYFIQAEESNWQRTLSIPGVNFVNNLHQLLSEGVKSENIISWIDLGFLVFGIGLVLRSIRWLRHSYAVFGLALLALPLLTNSFVSMPRFLLPIFPVFILLALWVEKSDFKRLITWVVFVTLSTVFVVRFMTGFWIS
ncbi:hypothetical protein HY389_02570 [Candidatus Daviesbacteria bacterium]|nr:hypothetical protein [Candidatus Daviesbacteria bacterium]